MFGCWVRLRRWKVIKDFIYFSYCLAAVPASWLFQASEGMLAQKLSTLASTILLLQWIEIIQTKSICKEVSLANRLHTNYPCPFCQTNFINKEEVIKQEPTQNLMCWS